MRPIMTLVYLSLGVLAAGPAAHADGLAGRISLARGAAREAVVYLEGGAKAPPLTHAMVDQRDKMFEPHVLVVTRGTTVRFPNDDTIFHNVFAYFQAKKFDLGMYPRGATKSITFDKAGLVVLLCNVHSDMSAYIMVVDTPYYAVTDAQGRFRMPNVPPGAYTLHAWHESGAEQTQAVTVGPRMIPLALMLSRK